MKILPAMNGIRILSFTLLTILLAACNDNTTTDDSRALPIDPGNGYKERTYSVSRNKKDNGQVTLRFYDDMPNVAYIAASAYYRLMLPDASMSVVNAGDCYRLSTADATVTVDVKNDVLTSDSYNKFVSLQSLIASGLPEFETCFNPFLRYDSHVYTPAEHTTTLNFKKYGIDLRDDGQEVFFPFSTINDMFTDASGHIACFDGNTIVVCAEDHAVDIEEMYPDYAVNAYKTVEVSDDLAAFRYGELCFVIDYFYGYPNRNLLEKEGLREHGLDAVLDVVSGGKEVKELLQSQNQAAFVAGTEALNYLMNDGGHMRCGLWSYAPANVNGIFAERISEALNGLPASTRQMVEALDQIRMKRKLRKAELQAIRDKKYGSDIYVKSQDGKTAVLVMKSFMDLNTQGWRTYYASNHTTEDWQKMVSDKKQDLVVLTVEALKRAKSEGVKNLVLDVSTNGGGEDDPTTAIVALLGDKTASLRTSRKTSSWEYDMLSLQHLTKTFVVDRNFDGKFDEQDDKTDWVGDMNIVVLTSDYTFSNGSVFTAKMKDFGYQIWGQQSGGGACSIQTLVTPDGMAYTISSYRSHTTDRNKQSIDGGTPVNKLLTDDQMYDIEYLNSLF